MLAGDLGQAKFPTNHLALFGDPDLPHDTSGGLGQNGVVRGTAAAAYRTASPVEKGQVNIVVFSDGCQQFLCLVLRPTGCQGSSIFGTVAVADHDFLLVTD